MSLGPVEAGTLRRTQLRMRHTWRSACTVQIVLDDMASTLASSFVQNALFVGRAQEAEDLLQKLGIRFRGLQARMFLEFCLNRRDVIAVMPTAGACSLSDACAHRSSAWRSLMHQGFLCSASYAPTSLCCGWLQVARASL